MEMKCYLRAGFFGDDDTFNRCPMTKQERSRFRGLEVTANLYIRSKFRYFPRRTRDRGGVSISMIGSFSHLDISYIDILEEREEHFETRLHRSKR
jgi:hypothetical protein